ncbi:MAG: flagellar basal body P-ring protein FlgI [Thermoguttaceae bacterium]
MPRERLPRLLRPGLLLAAAALAAACRPATASAAGHLTLKSICRIKGHEENSLEGLGIVAGLKGTGDSASYLPTIRSVAKVMSLMHSAPGSNALLELKDTKNVALVLVTATVPAMGARQGDKIDAVVSSIGSAKSLAGGRLFLTPLVGPDPHNPRVYAFAEGPLTLDSSATPTTARIHEGCRLEEDFFNVFTKDNKITLVLEKHHADFQVAQDVTEAINSQLRLQTSSQMPAAHALNPGNIEVTIPIQYRDDPVSFVSQVLSLPILEPKTGARVVINERAGSIIISGDVEIGSVAITHKNIVIETGTSGARPFVAVDPVDPSSPKLKALVESLNAIHAPTEDIIEIIKGLERDGKLHAPLVVQ